MLLDMVTQQTTRFEKAVMELIMNGIDAGATQIGVTLDSNWLQVQDNGKGLPHDEETMLACFQSVGNPHALDEYGRSTDAKFGRFRIGRLQMLGYGWVTYKSGPWTLDVRVVDKAGQHVSARDVHARHDVGFDQVREDRAYDNSLVLVKLDRALNAWEVDAMVDQISKWCRHSIVPVWINGTQVSSSPDEDPKRWNLVTDNAWMDLKQGDRDYGCLDVYMHGIFVCQHHANTNGVSGTVVAKKQMLVDYGRQGVNSDCPVWSSILRSLKSWGGERFVRVKGRATKSEVQAAWRDIIVTKDLSAYGGRDKFRTLHVFRDINGFSHSWAQLVKMFRDGTLKPSPNGKMLISFAQLGDQRAVKIHEDHHACVLDRSLFESLFADKGKHDIPTRLRDALAHWVDLTTTEILDIEQIHPEFKESYEIIPDARYTPEQRAYVSLLQDIYWMTARAAFTHARSSGTEVSEVIQAHQRRYMRLGFGSSTTAEAWTDGRTYIRYDWEHFKSYLPLTVGSLSRIVRTIQHEMCHEEATHGTHEHSGEFYRNYHELQMATEEDVMNGLMSRMCGYASRAGGPAFRKSDAKSILNHFKSTMLGAKALELWFARQLDKSSTRTAELQWENFVGCDLKEMLEVDYAARRK